MIEKIPEHHDFTPVDLRDKLNEIIDVVNAMQPLFSLLQNGPSHHLGDPEE